MLRVFISLFLSLTNLIFLCIVLGWIFLFRKKTRIAGRIIILVSIICLYLFSITPISDIAISPLESQYPSCNLNNISKADDVAVLAGGIKGDNLPLVSSISGSTLVRVSEAIDIYRHYPGLKFIVSGENDATKRVKEYLIDLGVPGQNIILDSESHNTFQNALHIKKIVGSHNLILVTSAFHMPRTMLAFRNLGMNPYPCPTDFKVEGSYNIFDFIPSTSNLHNVNLAFHEYIGILLYKFYAH